MNTNDQCTQNDLAEIISMIYSGAALNKVLEFITKTIERSFYPIQVHASIMLYDPIRKKLGSMIGPSLSQNYIKSIEPMDIGPYEGSCGTAAFLKVPVIIADIDEDPLWDKYRNLANQNGYRACWSTPILSSKNDLMGTLALYFKEVYHPHTGLIQKLQVYEHLTALAIQLAFNKEKCFSKAVPSTPRSERQFTTETQNENRQWNRELQEALLKEEFKIYYQPSFDLKLGCVGLEALIRWNHPNLGILAPNRFLHIAEETDFILELEKWVLTKAIKDVQSFQNHDLKNMTLSVNISAKQLENPNFPERVLQILQYSLFNPQNLILEITERFLINLENIETVRKLRELGIRISIDDFGTSYSSLQYLKDLPVDELKIDRSFIDNMEMDLNKQKIVEMIIELGHQLNLKIVGEGIETKKQFQLLQEMHCDKVQGFLFSKPLPLSKFKKGNLQQIKELVTHHF
ncbi:sensor domain-containing phosphodiesterase [Bacillus niameyensis]|uniref:sensor domain-containing phosphodiesterase n=1 Tax=Bacillus niameyensis TaxID=1522308 RepID=UPI00078174E6|nr:EAL domain-containing protein [Bacillus niameyensis]